MDAGNYDNSNREMVERLQNLGFLKNPIIIDAFVNVPRHMFVPNEQLPYAYSDQPLPIANESTISQPETVAVMLEALDPKPGNRILEIGTGSGWQTCLLAYCVGYAGTVISIEIDKTVFKIGKRNIGASGFDNIKVILGDGSEGYSRAAPYDRIIFTAAAPEVPGSVVGQLKVGGRLLIPVSKTSLAQRLIAIDKISEGYTEEKDFGDFVFVPLHGKGGYQ